MQQLSGLDSLFLRCEVGNTYLHIGPVMVYTVPAKRATPDIDEIKAFFANRLHCSAIFRNKIVEVPGKLDNPYWFEEADIDLENHIQACHLPSPGNWSQLCEEISRVHARPLERSRPLWNAHVFFGLDSIKGLPKGSFAIYFKTHHAGMDGATGAGIVEAVHEKKSTVMGELLQESWPGEKPPRALALLSKALINNTRQPFKLAGVIRKAVPSIARIVKSKNEGQIASTESRERTRFNHLIGPDRVCGFIKMDFQDVKNIRQQVSGATVNDVMLTIISGAMSHYLGAKGESPSQSLVAGVPVNVRTTAQKNTGANVVSMMSVPLCSDVENPLERLSRVHLQTDVSKNYHQMLGPGLLPDLCNALPPYLLAHLSRPVFSSGVLDITPTLFNTVVTNVPGPREPMFLGHAKMKMILGLGPIVDSVGLFHTVSSCSDVLTIGFQACPGMLPDPDFYTDCIMAAYDELLALVL